MREPLSAEDRRHIRTSVIASLAFVCTFLLSGLAWAGSTEPKKGEDRPAAAATAIRVENGPAPEQGSLGCGCDEACLVR